jgi:hypothetical protein
MHFLIICFFVHSADVADEEKKPAAAPTVSDSQSGHPPATLEPCVINTVEGSQDNPQNDNVEDQGIPPVESPSAANVTAVATSSTTVRAQLEPRQTQPGAFRVAGIDGEDEIHDDTEDIVTETTTIESGIVDPNNPVSAEVVDEDEENRRIQEKVDREVAERERERAEQEGEIPEAVIVNFSTRLKIWSSVAVVLLVTVAVVLGTVLPQQIKANSNKTTDPPTPSPQEVIQELERLLIPVTFDNGTALRNASSPQNNALNWLAKNTNLDSYLDAQKIHRYALATLFFSTNGAGWNDNGTWMSNEDECRWYSNGAGLCISGSIDSLSLGGNNLVGTIPNELALLSNLCESSVVWLLVVMIVLSCVFFIVPSCLLVIFHSTAYLDLSDNSLTGTIPSQITLLSNLCESSVVWLLVVMIVLSCVFHCTLIFTCHIHSTAYLDLSSNNLMGTIPSEVGLMFNLGESSVVWLLVVMIVLSCVFHCTLMLSCHFSFYS